jgi:hypothetical protein
MQAVFREIVVDASGPMKSNAQAYATASRNAAGAVENFTSNQLMMMGV